MNRRVSRIYPQKMLPNYKRKNSNANEGACREHLNQVIEVNIVRNGRCGHPVSPDQMHLEGQRMIN